MNPYVELTRAFNAGGLRAIVSSGQAVVLHRLSMTSKDGDWIVRETPEALGHVLGVLADRAAGYRFGAPLDVRWMRGGWSAHLEHRHEGLRLRTDFVTRPPRIAPDGLAALWQAATTARLPVVDIWNLIALKQTGRERDYAVIGELARRLTDPAQQLRVSRSADDLLDLAAHDPELAKHLANERPLLTLALDGRRSAVEEALDAERRRLMQADVSRVTRYLAAAAPFASGWTGLQRVLAGAPLREQHERIVEAALATLPFEVTGAST